MEKKQNQIEKRETFDLLELFLMIKKYSWVIVIVVILTGTMGYIGSKYLIDPQYESAITMIVNTRQDNSGIVTNDNITSAQNLVSTYSVIVRSNTVLNKVISTLNLDMSYSDLEKNVYVNAVDDTQIMRVAVRNTDRELSGKIVDTIAVIAPSIIVETVEAGSCKVISTVMTSETPVTPNVKKNALLMAALGFMVSLMAIIVVSMFKVKKIVDDNDAQKYLDLPLLGVIPELGGR